MRQLGHDMGNWTPSACDLVPGRKSLLALARRCLMLNSIRGDVYFWPVPLLTTVVSSTCGPGHWSPLSYLTPSLYGSSHENGGRLQLEGRILPETVGRTSTSCIVPPLIAVPVRNRTMGRGDRRRSSSGQALQITDGAGTIRCRFYCVG